MKYLAFNLFCLLIIVLVLIYRRQFYCVYIRGRWVCDKKIEHFGASQGGVLQQLAASHVPTVDDYYLWKAQEKQIKHDLAKMSPD
jgi:hypothetical protein